MRTITLLLAAALLAPAGEPPPDAVCRSHDLADLAGDALTVAFARVRAVVGDAEIRIRSKAIELAVPPAVHERVERVLKEVREGRGKVIALELHVVKLDGGPGTTEVPADNLDGFLKEKRAERIAAHTFACRNLCRASASFERERPYVADFDIEVGTGDVTVRDPAVGIAKETWTARLEPAVVGPAVRVAAEFSITVVVTDEFFTTLGADIGTAISTAVPEVLKAESALACVPDKFSVVDLGGSMFALVRATVSDAPKGR